MAIHYKPLTLTINSTQYAFVRNAGEPQWVDCVNDIVSTSRRTDGGEHLRFRRYDLLRAALAGGYDKVRIRCDDRLYTPCRCKEIKGDGCHYLDDTMCQFKALVVPCAGEEKYDRTKENE